MDIFGMAVQLFFMFDPVGNIPVVTGLIKDYTPKRQRMIIVRESLFALGVTVLFMVFGEHIMKALDIRQESMGMTGGVILFLIGLKMSMGSGSVADEADGDREPFVVPIAVPFIAGPGIMAMVMVMGGDPARLSGSIVALFAAWLASTVVLLLGQFLVKFLGGRAMEAIQKLMGLALTAMAVNMFMAGFKSFMSFPVK